jgi:hypothetical protein
MTFMEKSFKEELPMNRDMKIELMSMWYNEEFLAPFFLSHYRFVDKIHIFLDADTNDRTRNEIDKASELYKNISVQEFTFPDKMDDIIKIVKLNEFYKTIDSDYVFLADADEFIFYPAGYLEANPQIIHFTKLWNVYRHHTEQDLNPERPIREQRRHGVSDFEGFDVYTKPNMVMAKQDFSWALGHHAGFLQGQAVDWYASHELFPPGVSRMDPLPGAHWAMADPAFAVERRMKGRKERQSQVNLQLGLTIQHHFITEEAIRTSMKLHENDPQVL